MVKKDSTPDKGQADIKEMSEEDFLEDLDSRFDEDSSSKEDVSSDTKETAPTDSPEDLEAKDVVDSSVNEEVISPEEQKPKLEAPHHWSQQEKDLFASLDLTGQEAMMSTWKNWQSGYNQKFEELSDKRKFADSVFQSISDEDRRSLSMRGLDEGTYVKQLIELDRFAGKDFVGFLNHVCQQKGTTLKDVVNMLENQDPYVAQMAQANSHWQNQFGGMQDTINNLQKSLIQKDIDVFKDQKNEKGELVHKYFAELEGDMVSINQMTGEKDLNNLYEAALFKRKDIRDKILQEENSKKTKIINERKDLEKAKKAGKPMSNSPGITAEDNDLSMDEFLEKLDREFGE